MTTELATIVYNNLVLALTGKTYFDANNIYYGHTPDYVNYDDSHVIFDFSGVQFPETLDNNKLNKYNLVIQILIKPEQEENGFFIERAIINWFTNLLDPYVKDTHLISTNKNYDELLDIFAKQINIDLIYVQ